MALTGLASAQVYAKKLPTDRDVTLPCVVCSYPPNEAERMAAGTNQRTDVGLPVQVTILDADNQDLTIGTDAEKMAEWRRSILLHFHGQRLTGVSEVHYCTVEPRQIVDLEAWNRNINASALVVVCWARQAAV